MQPLMKAREPALSKAALVVGHNIQLRDANPADAAFILSLRTDPTKNRHLSVVPDDLAAQRAWLTRYAGDETQAYFIIEDRSGRAVGTVRLYDAHDGSFCWGSWILKDAPAHAAVESALLVYAYASSLGFEACHFDVRQGNDKVWQFHERMGAALASETTLDRFYTLGRSDWLEFAERYADRLPTGVKITPLRNRRVNRLVHPPVNIDDVRRAVG